MAFLRWVRVDGTTKDALFEASCSPSSTLHTARSPRTAGRTALPHCTPAPDRARSTDRQQDAELDRGRVHFPVCVCLYHSVRACACVRAHGSK